MEYVLENEHARLECMEQAGQMKHFIDKDRNVELLYQGDQGWSGRNPSLFPIVGNTWTKDYTIDGKTYAMKNHGLIRYADLKGKQEEDAICFTFDSNEETKAQYPFDFHYEMKYTLEQKHVRSIMRSQIQGPRPCRLHLVCIRLFVFRKIRKKRLKTILLSLKRKNMPNRC